MSARRHRWLIAPILLLVLAAAAATALRRSTPADAATAPRATPPAHAARAHRAAAAPIGFSHAVIVDQQRPGNEPDIKVDGKGVVYSSIPFGFSTTQSFIWSSRDHGNSFGFVPGTIGPGKPATCAGGGDTDLFLDPGNALYFSDLQGLTNISNSVSTDGGATFSTNCAGAPNTPDDRMWFAGSGSLAKKNLALYQDYDATNTGASPSQTAGSNQLVETVSTDGTHFQPVVNSDAGALAGDCAGAALQDCVTDNEGISGNQVVDPKTGDVFIAHTTIEGTGNEVGVRVAEGKITLGTPATASWKESPNLDGPLCPGTTKASDGSFTCVDSSGNPTELAGENFASIAEDSAGYLYVTFTAGPLDHAKSSDPNFGALTAPEQIYVVRSLTPVGADLTKLKWSDPQAVTGSGASAGTNTFPWITAGSDGRVAVAYYHADAKSEQGPCASGSGTCTLYGASSLTKGEWSVQLSESLNAHDATPAYTNAQVSEAPVKYGQICTKGLGCASGGDRSLGDFLQATTDSAGAVLVTYVFDTSADTSAGENAGPEAISRQITGPSLNAATPDVSQGSGPGVPMGSVTDPTGDANLPQNGTRTPDPTGNLDLTAASLANGPGRTLDATIKVKSLSSLAVSTSLGGPDASWILRFTVVKPGTTGNGDIFYLGMDNNAGAGGSGTPSFFAGDTAGLPPNNPGEHTKYMTFPQTTALSPSQASYNAKTGVISFHVPLSLFGNPPDGTVLLSGTAFSATSAAPQSAGNVFNLIDATTPFELVIGAAGSPGTSQTSGGGVVKVTPKPKRPGCPAASGRVTSTAVGPFRLGESRARARRADPHHSTHGRVQQDFFCVRPVGIRAGYGFAKVLRGLRRAQARKLNGRIVLLLTANPRLSLRGIHPGLSLAKARRRARLGRALTIGKNTWYLLGNGRSTGILKVRRGKVFEVGIAEKRLTALRSRERRLLSVFG